MQAVVRRHGTALQSRIFYPFSARRKRIIGLICCCTFLLFVLVPRLYRHDVSKELWGDMWDNHMVPSFTLLGLGVAVLVFFVLHMRPKVSLLLVVFVIFVIGVEGLVASSSWSVGLWGENLEYYSESCPITIEIPWMNAFPRRIMNFYMGSESCAPKGKKFFSKLDPATGLLTIDCQDRRTAYYTENTTNMNYLSPQDVQMFDAEVLQLVEKEQIGEEVKVPYERPVLVETEFVKAYCKGIEEYHVRNVPKPAVIERVKALRESSDRKPNVLMIMVDALSRAQFMRSMKKTARVLESYRGSNDNEAYQFFRYGVVGHNTGPNLTPMMSGSDHNSLNARVADKMIWKRFEEAGYVTTFSAVQCQDYMLNYWRFRTPVIDHAVASPYCHPQYAVQTVSRGPYSITRRCIDDRYVHTYAMDYTRSFWDNYSEFRKWAFVSFLEAHEGTLAVVKTLDDDLASFVREMVDTKDTFVFLFSDHGNHMGAWYEFSEVGRAEHILPFLVMIAPRWYLEKLDSMDAESISKQGVDLVLKGNAQKLVAAYDIFQTLRVLAGDLGGDENGRAPGQSLFTEISKDRGCEDALIPPEFCPCKREFVAVQAEEEAKKKALKR